MRNLIGELISCLNPGLGFSKYSCAVAHTCEIVSGYVSPQDETDRNLRSGDPYRGQVGILYADIGAPGPPAERLGDDTRGCLDQAINTLLANIADNDGRLVCIDGYAILAEFKDMDRALHCAINLQLAARECNSKPSFERQLLFRIGITSAAKVSCQEGFSDKSKRLAAYLEKLASAGGICISESARVELDDHPGIKIVGAGKQYVKNLCVPVEVFWIEIDTDQFISQDLTGAVKVTAAIS